MRSFKTSVTLYQSRRHNIPEDFSIIAVRTSGIKLSSKTGNVRINLTLRRVRVTIFVVEKAVSIAYSGYVFVALVVQHTKRSRRVILSYVACPAVKKFSVLSHKSFPYYLTTVFRIISQKFIVLSHKRFPHYLSNVFRIISQTLSVLSHKSFPHYVTKVFRIISKKFSVLSHKVFRISHKRFPYYLTNVSRIMSQTFSALSHKSSRL